MTETMVHLLASKDDVRAAQYYGDPSLAKKNCKAPRERSPML